MRRSHRHEAQFARILGHLEHAATSAVCIGRQPAKPQRYGLDTLRSNWRQPALHPSFVAAGRARCLRGLDQIRHKLRVEIGCLDTPPTHAIEVIQWIGGRKSGHSEHAFIHRPESKIGGDWLACVSIYDLHFSSQRRVGTDLRRRPPNYRKLTVARRNTQIRYPKCPVRKPFFSRFYRTQNAHSHVSVRPQFLRDGQEKLGCVLRRLGDGGGKHPVLFERENDSSCKRRLDQKMGYIPDRVLVAVQHQLHRFWLLHRPWLKLPASRGSKETDRRLRPLGRADSKQVLAAVGRGPFEKAAPAREANRRSRDRIQLASRCEVVAIALHPHDRIPADARHSCLQRRHLRERPFGSNRHNVKAERFPHRHDVITRRAYPNVVGHGIQRSAEALG